MGEALDVPGLDDLGMAPEPDSVESSARESIVPKHLVAALEASARCGETTVINDGLRINPDALHLVKIRVTPYEISPEVRAASRSPMTSSPDGIAQ